jgi:hypothetical protein
MNIKIENVQNVWFTVVAGFMQKGVGCSEALREVKIKTDYRRSLNMNEAGKNRV